MDRYYFVSRRNQATYQVGSSSYSQASSDKFRQITRLFSDMIGWVVWYPADLDTQLHDIMNQDDGSREKDATHALSNNVFTPVDEIDFWERQSGRGVEGEAMTVFRNALSPLKQVSAK